MKNTILTILMTILVYNCTAQIKENQIIGNWKVIKFNSDTPELSKAIIEGAKVEALSSYYSFHKDKTFNMKSKFIFKGEGGKYEFISERRTIKMVYAPGGLKNMEEYQIESLNANSMKWTQDMGDLGSISMTLKKE